MLLSTLDGRVALEYALVCVHITSFILNTKNKIQHIIITRSRSVMIELMCML